MSKVSYGTGANKVSLPYAMTSSYSMEAIPDPSDTDWTYQKIDLTVQGVINTAYIGLIDPTIPAGSSAATIVNTIRPKLMARRQPLEFSLGGVDIVPQKPDGNAGNVDARNGPIPQYCNLQVLTNTTILFTYRIIGHYWETGTAYPTISNKWTETVDIDSRNYTVRTREGLCIIRSDNSTGQTADSDAVRNTMAVVGIPNGFKRVSSSYTVNPDGLGLKYRVVDKEVYFQPPDPAYEAEGSYTESTTKLGAVRHGLVVVTLKGAKGQISERGKLVFAALSIASTKLRSNGAMVQGGVFTALEQSSVKVDLWENNVTVVMQAMMQPIKVANVQGMAGLDFTEMLTPPKGCGDGTPPPTMFARGTAGYLCQAAAYYDPGAKVQLQQITGQLSEGKQPGQAGKGGG